jgi:hypothetical protein
MSVATEVRINKLEAENEERKAENRVLRAGMDALLERFELMEALQISNNNAVVEGDEVEVTTTKAARNGQVKRTNR